MVKTNSQGQAILSLKNQHPGRYSVVSKFEGSGKYTAIDITNSIKISLKKTCLLF